ncbi:MAG: LysR family transcriptional regulator [Beijerinckiaceae bacterium]|nr:LysR family transcriptional regulator [Beijerinckiaceae bacterium]MCI0734994.1 LysR family transcriptional regulator [Beijerinckiaceae bacterium]
MDRIESMAIFVAAAELGSLSAAARRLGMPLATVSRKVSDLEAHLKTRLLNRSGRRLILTGPGQSYVAACKRILEDVNEAERAASGEYSAPKGELIITAPIVFGRLHVLPVAAEFLRSFPQIDVRLLLTDRVVNLFEEHIDLAVRIGALPDSSLMATRAGSIRLVACGSPVYFAAHGTPKRPQDLSAHDCISFEGLTSSHSWSFIRNKIDVPVAVRSRLKVNTAEAAIDAAIAGIGVTRVLSYQTRDAVMAGKLALVLEDFEPAPVPVSLVYAEHGPMLLKLRAFLDFAVPRLKARLSRKMA